MAAMSSDGVSAQIYLYAVPPIHGESYHVATDKDPSIVPVYIFNDNRQLIATRGKKARGR